jgi:hypothetical protein
MGTIYSRRCRGSIWNKIDFRAVQVYINAGLVVDEGFIGAVESVMAQERY